MNVETQDDENKRRLERFFLQALDGAWVCDHPSVEHFWIYHATVLGPVSARELSLSLMALAENPEARGAFDLERRRVVDGRTLEGWLLDAAECIFAASEDMEAEERESPGALERNRSEFRSQVMSFGLRSPGARLRALFLRATIHDEEVDWLFEFAEVTPLDVVSAVIVDLENLARSGRTSAELTEQLNAEYMLPGAAVRDEGDTVEWFEWIARTLAQIASDRSRIRFVLLTDEV